MSDLKELRAAAKELVSVLGLVDNKKKPIVINKDTSKKALEKVITDALPLITDDDEFSPETQDVLDAYQEPEDEEEQDDQEDEEEQDDDAVEEAEEETEEEDDDEEDDEEEETPKSKAKTAQKIHDKNIKNKPVKVVEDKGKGTPKKDKGEGKKPTFKREGSLAQLMDETAKEGGDWDEMMAIITKGATERGTKMSLGGFKAHVKYRLSKDPKFLGKMKLTDEGIQ